MDTALKVRLEKLFDGVDKIATALLARELLTINRFYPEQMSLERLFSSNPQAYPPGGRKQKRGTAWGQQVLLDQHVFIGEGVDAIRQSFDDYDTIVQLGLQSVINIPISDGGHCLGTLNILMKHPRIEPQQRQAAEQLGLLIQPGLLLLPR